MRQKKKLLLAGILCCMCLGSVCVSIGVRGRFPRKIREGQMQIEEQKLPEKTKNKQEYKEENRQEEAAAEQKERSTESGTEKNVPNVPAPKTGDSWWK